MDDKNAPLDPEKLTPDELRRFTKTSHSLILEEYDHCEVPAGCGGVVLRWVNPDSPMRIGVRVYGKGSAQGFYLDGERVGTSQADLAPGRHVLVLALNYREPSPPGEASMAVISTRYSRVKRHGDVLPELTLPSRANGSWLGSTQQPDAHALTAHEPDPEVWRPLTPATLTEPEEDYMRWSWDACVESGAEAFAVPEGLKSFWLRVLVDVPKPPALEAP